MLQYLGDLSARVRQLPPHQLAAGAFIGFGASYAALQPHPGGRKKFAPRPSSRQASAARDAARPSVPAAPAPAPATSRGPGTSSPGDAAAGLHFDDCVDCAQLIADKITERVSLARSKIAGGEEHEKAVGVLWGISVGKRSIFEERQTSQAEYDASCEALLSGGGVGSTGRDMRQLKTVPQPSPCSTAQRCAR
jgi:hypothetical protein